MFNSYMLLTLPFNSPLFHLCDVHYSEVAHLHENGRLSERDKPKASSCELDVVFGIPNSREKGFFPPADAELAPSKLLAPSVTAPALPAPIILWVQRLLKYCCNPVDVHPRLPLRNKSQSRQSAEGGKSRCTFIPEPSAGMAKTVPEQWADIQQETDGTPGLC